MYGRTLGAEGDNKMNRDVIIACDFNSKEELVRFLERFGEESIFLKVGMELFYAEGPEIIREIQM